MQSKNLTKNLPLSEKKEAKPFAEGRPLFLFHWLTPFFTDLRIFAPLVVNGTYCTQWLRTNFHAT